MNAGDTDDKAVAQKVFNTKSAFYKNVTLRVDELIYKKQESGNPNAFNISPSYGGVDAASRNQRWTSPFHHGGKETLHTVVPCVLGQTECSLEKRKKAKKQNKQSYNSFIKMGRNYFANEGLAHRTADQEVLQSHFKMLRENMTDTSTNAALSRQQRASGLAFKSGTIQTSPI